MAVGFLICYGIRGVELNYLRWITRKSSCGLTIETEQVQVLQKRLQFKIDPPDMQGLSESLIVGGHLR